jgi:predicted phosphodiesterase
MIKDLTTNSTSIHKPHINGLSVINNMNTLGKAQIARDYVERFSELSKRAVSVKIHLDNPLIFKDAEDARTYVRYITGSQGESHRKKATHKGYCIPKSKAKKSAPYNLPQEFNNILWLSDIHIPNHNEKALQLSIEYGIANNINCILLGGDIIDNNPFTRFDKKPDRGEAKKMFDDVYDFLVGLKLTFPDIKIIWLEGNHDKWYEKWLAKNAPMVFDDPYYQMEERLRLNELEIMYLKEKQILKIDGLHCLHGHTLIKGVFSPVNPARGIFLRAKASTIIGHCHQSSKHTESNLKGNIISCFSTGCLCELNPDYDPHNTKHNLGFAHITRANGNFHVRNLEIYNNQIL